MDTYEKRSVATLVLLPAIFVGAAIAFTVWYGNWRGERLEEAMQAYEDCLRDRTGMGIYEWRATGRELPKLDNC